MDKHDISYSNQQATLRIINANAKDSGHYTLLAENPQGCQVSSAILAIEAAHEQANVERSTQEFIESTETTKALTPAFVTLIPGTDDR